MDNMNTQTQHTAQLLEWWGNEADGFPGDFSLWLLYRIETGESENLEMDLQTLNDELRVNAKNSRNYE
jgi:hypothetical protein